MSNRIKARINTFIPDELPELIMPHIELCSQSRAIVEGCKGILQYTSDTVSLNCKNVIVSFCWENLSLCNLNDETITVTGKISCINYI